MNDTKVGKTLTKEQYRILHEKGTEAPHTGKYNKHYEKGMYKCVGCGQQLFASDTKYDSKSGWPSFTDALPGAVELKTDTSYGMKRTEVVCSSCGGHLGHVFEDGPRELDGKKCSGKRYCINSAILDFKSTESN